MTLDGLMMLPPQVLLSSDAADGTKSKEEREEELDHYSWLLPSVWGLIKMPN